MTEKTISLVISQLEAEKYLNAIGFLQDEILKIEVRTDPADRPASSKREIKTLSGLIEKISEAALFGDEWEEGRRAKTAAISRLQKMGDIAG